MKTFRKTIVGLLTISLLGIGSLSAKGYKSPTYKPRPTPSSSKTTTKPSKGWGSTSKSKPKTPPPKPKMTFKDQKQKAAYEKAQKNGTAFKTKAEAQKDFKAKHATKYKSTYTTKPATRPEHIPQSTKGSDGNTYNVSYNQDRGGYGFTNALGAFVMYDMMSDAVMMNSMMARNNYAVHPAHGSHVHATSSGNGFLIFICIIGGVILVFVLIAVASR